MPPRKEICDCSTLERASRDPEHVIRWDEAMNEYYIAHGKGGQMSVYYSPFCGGSTPKSRRASLFTHISLGESVRIMRLLQGIEVVADVTARFGPPDEERKGGGTMYQHKSSGTQGPLQLYAIRTLVYKGISPVADVEFMVGLNDVVQHCYRDKVHWR